MRAMADYFYLHDGAWFEDVARPALTDAWRGRDFTACRTLATSLLPAARDYRVRYHTSAVEPLLAAVVTGVPFDRALWRHLVGEVLLFGAKEIPELPTCAETLCCLLAPEQYAARAATRERMPAIEQAHFGSRDLR